MECFVISAKFVPLKYYTLSSQLRRLTSFSVGLFGSANSVTRSYPVMRKSCIRRYPALLSIVATSEPRRDYTSSTKRSRAFCQDKLSKNTSTEFPVCFIVSTGTVARPALRRPMRQVMRLPHNVLHSKKKK